MIFKKFFLLLTKIEKNEARIAEFLESIVIEVDKISAFSYDIEKLKQVRVETVALGARENELTLKIRMLEKKIEKLNEEIEYKKSERENE